MELRGTSQPRTAIELTSVLDELRVLIDTVGHEQGIAMQWEETGPLPLVWADRYGLMQVFLNLAKNSIRAMEKVEDRRLTIRTTAEPGRVRVHFEDTGGGIAEPLTLFRPFQSAAQGTGLGLYVSRALVKSFGGDLVYERREDGCCFTVLLERVSQSAEAADV
jgi:C4-dicarboxylate-specific signal transduction histidine kinase